MVVHTDDTRHDRVSSQVDYGSTFARELICAGRDAAYLAALDVDVLIRTRCRPRAIDDLHMFKHHFRRADFEVLAHLRPEHIHALGIGEFAVAQCRKATTQYCQQHVDSNLFRDATPFVLLER